MHNIRETNGDVSSVCYDSNVPDTLRCVQQNIQGVQIHKLTVIKWTLVPWLSYTSVFKEHTVVLTTLQHNIDGRELNSCRFGSYSEIVKQYRVKNTARA